MLINAIAFSVSLFKFFTVKARIEAVFWLMMWLMMWLINIVGLFFVVIASLSNGFSFPFLVANFLNYAP
jgi:hypothetical protein